MAVSASRARRAGTLVATGALIAASGLAALGGPQSAGASSHREAPNIAGLPQYDNTDVYAFVSPDRTKSVTFVANWFPFEEPAGGPNFYPFANDAFHDIHIDNNGDAKPDITYRWNFYDIARPGPEDSFTGLGTFLYNNGKVTALRDANLLYRQAYDLRVIIYRRDGSVKSNTLVLHDAPVAPSYVGKASMGTRPEYRENLRDRAIRSYGPSGSRSRSFAGQTEDPFFLDLRVFDLLYGGDLSEVGVDTLAGYNVNTIVLQVPAAQLAEGTLDDRDVIGVWSTTSERNAAGRHVQISRLGNPLVNEVIIPYHRKDAFNRSRPQDDARFAKYVLNPELPRIVEAIYGIPAPAPPRNDLVAAFLTGVEGLNKPASVTPSEQLRLRLKHFAGQKFSRLGVIGGDLNGFPNGRRLQDDVVDIELQVAEGVLLPGHPAIVEQLGDAVHENDVQFSNRFPYVAVPHSGSAPKGGAARNSNAAAHASLVGGATAGPPSASFPLVPAGLVGIGALTVLAGAVLIRRRGPLARPATA